MNLKDEKIRSEPHRRFVAGLVCCACGAAGCQAAHIRHNTGGGMGLKPSDVWVVPLCPRCHGVQHNAAELKFWERQFGIERIKDLAATLYAFTGDREECLQMVRHYRNGYILPCG